MRVNRWRVLFQRSVSILIVACLMVGLMPATPVAAAGLAGVSQSASSSGVPRSITIADAVGERAKLAGRTLAYHVATTPTKADSTTLPTTVDGPIKTIVPSPQVSILGAWQNPNQVLLRWLPQGEWIPEAGYSLYRVINGKRTELAIGLGRSDQASLSVLERDRLAGQLQAIGQKLSPAPAPDVVDDGWIEGPLVASHDDLTTLAGDLRSQIRLSDSVKQALLSKGLIRSSAGAAEAEKALYSLNVQAKLQPNKIISGQARFNDHFLQSLRTKASGPTLPASLNCVRPPVLLNKQLSIPLSQAVTPGGQAVKSAALSLALLSAAATEVSAPDALLQARHDLISLSNVRFELALIAGLAFIDQLDMSQVKTGDLISYELVPTPTAGSTPNPLARAKTTVKVGVEERPTPPTAMQGYGMDGRVYLRWDPGKDEYTKKILAGYVIERRQVTGDFVALNPYSPAVISYSADENGVLYEQAAYFTDDGLKNGQQQFTDGDHLYYRVYGVDIFGRHTPSSQPIDIDVIKTLPPTSPSVRQPVLATATESSHLSLNSEPLPISARKTALGGLPKLLSGLVTDSVSPVAPTSPVLSAVLDKGVYASQLSDEMAAQVSRALRMQAIRDQNPGKTGIFVAFSHSLQTKESRQEAAEAPQLSRDLTEYRVYRSEAEGSGRFAEPKLAKTISLQEPELYVPKANLKDDVLYYDTDVQPGRFYAYWITASDSWGNESSCSEPRVIGYPTPNAPAAPTPVQGSFAANQALFARERIPGFFQRYLPALGSATAGAPVSGAPVSGASLFKDQMTGVVPSSGGSVSKAI
ncbi:MAG: hypothetical protein ACM3ZQ_08565, partial [Bacillota bacterium]